MSELYWESKIRALLSAPIFGSLNNNTASYAIARSPSTSPNWLDRVQNSQHLDSTASAYLDLAAILGDRIASASDRASLNRYNFNSSNLQSLQITHLLSGASQTLPLGNNLQWQSDRLTISAEVTEELFAEIPSDCQNDPLQLFWYLWRCLPSITAKKLNAESILLAPATRAIPDSSIWSYTSIKSALTGALTGYNTTVDSITDPNNSQLELSHPYLAAFTFSPIQELVKASRKMRDFWAGSWVLHYLSAKVAWGLANKYGPDCLLYPSLYQQPLIDLWLRQKYESFKKYIDSPTDRQLLTAGFPNVLILILPKDKVPAAMQMAKSILLESWKDVSDLVLKELQQQRHWMPDLQADNKRWSGWLKHQWQTYWVGVPIGREWKPGEEGKLRENFSCDLETNNQLSIWSDNQNKAFNVHNDRKLFQPSEELFLISRCKSSNASAQNFDVNIGSWWGYIFDQTRLALAAVKNSRSWELPTAFDSRSSISGIGSAVHPEADKISESDIKQYWKHRAGLFDGREQLNATEVVKRSLHRVVHKLLDLRDDRIDNLYPDLTAGVAGYLKTAEPQQIEHFTEACKAIQKKIELDGREVSDLTTQKWGIPWVDEGNFERSEAYHSRLLNAGWLVEELKIDDTLERTAYRGELQELINTYYPDRNPANWYVIAAGDGDGMSEWLKGTKLGKYREYVDTDLANNTEYRELQNFLDLPKRMGPSTHSALSRSLLDFSNQLVPYLTETRYAGRLIYSGGDDVLAYTNLWEWDRWLWDVRQCFRGQPDPHQEFANDGHYWLWNRSDKSPVASRPLFTLGKKATISFGIVIAHHSVPLAIALSNLWEAEEAAKDHIYERKSQKTAKDALQVRVLYGSGNALVATAKFQVLQAWQKLVQLPDLDSSIFEQIANIYQLHPIPEFAAIAKWTQAAVSRRENLNSNNRQRFQDLTARFIKILWETTPPSDRDREIQRWLKLAAFAIRETRFTVNSPVRSV